jgi:hypothetical protein
MLALSGCGGGGGGDGSGDNSSEPSAKASATPSGEATASTAAKSCQGIIGSGAVEDIAKVFDKYKNNNTPFSTADAKAMHDALDRLAKAGDNASPKIREAVVQLVADAGSLIDSRAHLEGVGKVASVSTVQKEIDTLCR